MGAKERMQASANKIIDLYGELEDGVYLIIINALKDGDYKHVDPNDVVMWQAKQLNQINRLNEEAIQLMASKDGLSEKSIKDLIKFHGMKIIDEVDDEITDVTQDHDYQPVSADATAIMQSIANQTWTNLNNNVNESLVSYNHGNSAVTRAYRKILTDSTIATTSGLMTHEDAVNAAVYKLVDRGLDSNLIDKGGHSWSVDGYVRTVVNTTVNQTFNDLRMQRMQDYGLTTCVMSAHPMARPACAPIQGKVVNVVDHGDPGYDDRYPTIYDHGYGTAGGTQGVNCSHILIPFDPKLNKNHEPQYNPAEAIKNGKIVQQQRARERGIREAKKRLKAAQELGDAQGEAKAKALLRARQAKLRQFIKGTNAGRDNPLLSRDYSREKVF